MSLGHFSKQVLVSGSFATLQAKQSEGCKSSAPGVLQPEENNVCKNPKIGPFVIRSHVNYLEEELWDTII